MEDSASEKENKSGKIKILIAEDDFVSRRLMQSLLTNYGDYDVAKDGQKALDLFQVSLERNDFYDLVCLDIMMPEIDGLDVLKEMRKMENDWGIDNDQKAKIIMITALNDSESVIFAARFQCNGYLAKPIDKNKLEKQLLALGIIKEEIDENTDS